MDDDENSSSNVESIDWSKCFICQEFRNDEVLIEPKNKKPNQKRDGLKTLAEQIRRFDEINEIPEYCEKVKGLNEKYLKDSCAKYHKIQFKI